MLEELKTKISELFDPAGFSAAANRVVELINNFNIADEPDKSEAMKQLIGIRNRFDEVHSDCLRTRKLTQIEKLLFDEIDTQLSRVLLSVSRAVKHEKRIESLRWLAVGYGV